MQKEISKPLSLIIAAIITIVFIVQTLTGMQPIATYHGCNFASAVSYMFFHASAFHLLSNVWSIVYVGFYTRLPVWCYLVAFVSAAVFGIVYTYDQDNTTHITGFSTVIYTLIGLCLIECNTIRQAVTLQAYTAAYIILYWILFPQISAIAHISCYAIGLTFAYFNYPFIQKS